MSIEVTPLSEAAHRSREVAIGTFDGVHVGHRQVIEGADTVLTFEPHPLRVIHPEAAPKLIVIPFDRGFSEIEPEEFCSRILVETLGAERVAVGENFRFGKRAKGDPEMLGARGEFETRVVPLVEVDGETVSSSRVRALVAAGEVDAAMRCLGAPYLLEGEVVEGDRRGRELGFPTANIVPSDELVYPGHGVYAAFAHGHPAAVNVGVRPTFETGRGMLVESYLIDYDGDLYGRTLRVAFIARLRGEKRFESVEDLVAQMHRDVEDARDLCANFSPP